MIDYSKISEVEIDGIDFRDHPEYSDAYISAAKYNGVDMTEEEIEELNEHHSDFVGKCVHS